MDFLFIKVAHAQATSGVDLFITNVNRMIVNPLIYLLFAIAVVFFLYGVVEFLMNGENEEKRTTGKQHMLWGVIGLTIMIGVFAIIKLALDTFNLGDGINAQDGKVELREYRPTFPPGSSLNP